LPIGHARRTAAHLSSCHLPRQSPGPAGTAPTPVAARAHARSTYKKMGPRTSYRLPPFTAPIRSRPAGGRRGAPCGKNTRTRDTGLYMRPAGDCRPLQDACIGTKAQPDADPRAAATKTTPMMKTCTSRAHLTSEELTAQHRIALKASAAERRGFTRRRLLGRLLCR
jgi:hypothetical protein